MVFKTILGGYEEKTKEITDLAQRLSLSWGPTLGYGQEE